jgi:hypothetical protein
MLDVSWCQLITDVGVQYLVTRKSKDADSNIDIQYIDSNRNNDLIYPTTNENFDSNVIGDMSNDKTDMQMNLKVLKMIWCLNITHSILEYLFRLQSLECIDISGCEHINIDQVNRAKKLLNKEITIVMNEK